MRIMVFAEGEAARIAEEAGADYVGTDEYIARIQDGWLEFDVAVAVPQVMSKIGRLGRILGSRGLMPNPRAGTIVQPDEIPTTIQQLRQGRVEFRVDRTGNIHIPIGKVSFTSEQLLANWGAIMWRPSSVHGRRRVGAGTSGITIAPTMGPGVRVDVGAAQALRGSGRRQPHRRRRQ